MELRQPAHPTWVKHGDFQYRIVGTLTLPCVTAEVLYEDLDVEFGDPKIMGDEDFPN